MRIFGCNTETINYQIVELPRVNWHYSPPKKLEVVLTVAVIILTAIAWSIF